MLILSRKQEQSIVIGENIKVQILGVSGNTVRIGIEAPSEVKIMREELIVQKPVTPKGLLDKQRNYQGRRMAVVPTATSA